MRHIWGVAWFIVGVTCGVFITAVRGVRFADTVDLADFLNVLVTIFLALLVALFGNKWFSEQRAEKDLLIRRLQHVLETTRSLDQLVTTSFNAGQVEKDQTLTALDELGSGISDLLRDFDYGKYKKEWGKLRPVYTDTFLSLRRAASGGEFPSAPYTVEVYYESHRLLNEIGITLEELIFDVNRH